MKRKLNILISNDDGYNSVGIRALAKEFNKIANIIVVAPISQKSGVSNSFTFTQPLTVKHHIIDNINYYAISGTPVDCIKIAMAELLDEKPDIILSGINSGRNTAINILYSGTLGAAMEGYLLGIPSAAISLDSGTNEEHYSDAAEIAREVIEKYIINNNISEKLLLNINIPDVPKKEIKGIKLTKIASTIWEDIFEKRIAPFGWNYYWYSGKFEYLSKDTDSDDGAVKNKYVSVSPLKIDFFNDKIFNELSKI